MFRPGFPRLSHPGLVHALPSIALIAQVYGGLDSLFHPQSRGAADRSTANGASTRDRTIVAVEKMGRRRWKKASGYHRQARVENTFFRYKSIFGGALRARSPGGQVAEVLVACNVLNQMTDLGRPDSYAISR